MVQSCLTGCLPFVLYENALLTDVGLGGTQNALQPNLSGKQDRRVVAWTLGSLVILFLKWLCSKVLYRGECVS